MKFLFALLITQLYAVSPTILILDINHTNDPELGNHLSRFINNGLSQLQEVNVLSTDETAQYIANEGLSPSKDRAEIISHYVARDSIALILSITLNEFSIKKERQDYLLVTGQQQMIQSLQLEVFDDQNKYVYNNTVQADTTFYTGYCGIFNCPQESLPVNKQLQGHTALLQQLSRAVIQIISDLLNIQK